MPTSSLSGSVLISPSSLSLVRGFLMVLTARPVSCATRASSASDSCAPSLFENVEDQLARATCDLHVRGCWLREEVFDVLGRSPISAA